MIEKKSELYEETEKWAKALLKKAQTPLGIEFDHAVSTQKNVLLLRPGASEELKIAALCHDIERSVTGITAKNHLLKYEDYNHYKEEHAKRSSEMVADFLRQEGATPIFIEKVAYLIRHHEVGGNAEADILRDADSISFFEMIVGKYIKDRGGKRAQDKIIFMASRVSPKALAIIKGIKYNDPEVEKIVLETIGSMR